MLGTVDNLVQDIRVAARSFRRRPAFHAAVLVTLGLGIGGAVAMFGVVDASLLRALPFPRSDRLVLGRVTWDGELGSLVSGMDFFDYREQATTLDGLSAFTPFAVEGVLAGDGPAERISTPLVSTGFFGTLGVEPMLGRTFRPEEGELDGPRVVMLSHDLWERRFGADRAVLGTTLILDGLPRTIVGVMPAGFFFYRHADLWQPLQRGSSWANARQFHNFLLLGRLADGTSVQAAQSEMDAVSHALQEGYPETNADKGLNLTPLREALTDDYRPVLTMLMAAVGLVLLIACANAAGLLLARGSTRRSELAVRSVMGAGRGRLARQLITESALLAVGAGVLGLALAIWLERGILAFVAMDHLGSVSPRLSDTVLGFAALLSIATVVIFGVVPALRTAHSDPARDLNNGTRSAGSVGATRARSTLVVAQVALTAVLLALSGLLLRSVDRLRHVDTGFRKDGLLTADVRIPGSKYPDAAQRTQLWTELESRVASLPGVADVALISALPVRDPGNNVRVGRPEAWGGQGVFGQTAYQRIVMPGYFSAMGIPLRGGRDVALTDHASAPPVIVLSQQLAERLFPGTDPLGRSVGYDVGRPDPAIAEVVGVVGDVVTSDLAQGAELAMYFPYPQRPTTSMRLAVRSAGPETGLAQGVREALRSIDPVVPLADVQTMEQVLASSVADRRAVVAVLGLFALVAALLAAVGLYGLLAFQVSQRVREIGIRLALGASAGRVSGGILRHGLTLVAVGLVLGIPGALLAARLIRQMLFGVREADPWTYLGLALLLGLIAALACLVPARRAASVDPADALRAE